MAEIASAFVTLIPSFKGGGSKIASQLGGPVDQAGKQSGKRFGNAMSMGIGGVGKRIFAPLALAAAAIGVGNFMKGAIGEARESQKVGAITAQVIKTTGGAAKVTAGQVGDLAAALSNKTGIDDEAIQSGANLLLTFKNVKNEVGAGNAIFNRATAAAADLSAAGFGSLSGASKQLGKALNDPVKGITALSRSGITFTAQQKEQIKTLVASGDSLSAQKIILGELESQVGGTAAASATAGEKFKTTFANFKEALGAAILPALDAILGGLTRFVGFLTTKVAPTVKNLSGVFKPVVDVFKVFFSVLTGTYSGKAFGPLTDGLKQVAHTAAVIRDAFIGALPAVKQFVTGGLKSLASAGGAIMSSLAPVLKQLPGLFAQLLPVLTTVGSTILSVFKGAFTQIGPLIAAVAGIVIGLFRLIAPAVQQLAPVIGAFLVSLQGLAETLIAAFQVVWPPIQRLIAGILTQLVPGLKAIFTVIATDVVPALKSFAQAIAPIIAWLVDKLAPIVTAVFGVVVGVIKGAMKIIAGVIKVVTSVIKGDWKGAWDGIKQILSGVWGIIKAVVVGAIKVVKSVISTGLGVIKAIWGRIWDAVKAVASKAWNGIKSLVSAGVAKIKGLIDGIGSIVGKVRGFFARVLSAIKEKLGDAVDFVKGIPDKITTALGDLGSLLKSAGEDVVQGLVDGISGAAHWVSDQVDKLVNLIPEPLRKKLGISSPSKVMAEIGKWIPLGLAKGIRGTSSAVVKEMARLAGRLLAMARARGGPMSQARKALEDLIRKGDFTYAFGQAFGVHEDDPLPNRILALRNALLRAASAGKTFTRAMPTRKTLTPAGTAVIEGFLDGIRKATPKVESQLRGLTNKLRSLGRSGLVSSLSDENKRLTVLSDHRVKVAGKLAAASKKLIGLQKQASDFAAQTRQSILATGDVTAQRNGDAFDIVGGLRKAVIQARAFASAISKLRKGGLNKTSLSQIIAAGPEGGLGTARNILAQGSIKAVNSLTGKLGKAGKSVGAQGAAAMYGAGIQAAKGLVRGLRSQESALTAVMKRIALSLVRQVKKALRIHSPSKVMADVAKFIPLGMVQGIESQSSKVDDAIRNLTRVTTVPFNPRQDAVTGGQGGIHIGTIQGYTAAEVATEIDRKTRQRETLAFAGGKR